MNRAKELLRRILRKSGYEIKKYKASGLGQDPFQDMSYFLSDVTEPMFFDVGANVGQTLLRVNWNLPDAFVHAFEPSPSTFVQLENNCKKLGMRNVRTWNVGAGSSKGTLALLENEQSYMSSFLPPGELCTGQLKKQTDVDVITLDEFAQEQNIPYIHVLKSDTQGYDFEVLKGAEQLMHENKIGLVYFEFIFSEQYKGIPSFDEVFRFLKDRNFHLVSFYKPHFQRNLLSWTDVLFVNANLYRDRVLSS